MNPRSELESLEQEIAELKPQVNELRRQIGERADGATDAVEVSQLLTEVEEQEAILARLEQRRDALSGR